MNKSDYDRHYGQWLRDRDPLRSRMALNSHQYGCAIVAFKRAHRRIPSGVKNFVAGCLVGVAGAAWLMMELSR